MNISLSVSDFLTDFTNRPKTAQVFAVEKDATFGQGQVFMVESIEKSNENVVMLMCKSTIRRPIDEIFSHMVENLERGKPTKTFKATIHKSEKDGKYFFNVDGVTMQSDFETEHEAKLFVRGYVLGFEMGSAGKN